MRKLAFYIAKGIKRQCKTYVLALFRKENSEQAAKQRLHKFYFEQKHIQNHNDTLHHKTAIMLTPYDTEPDRRQTTAGNRNKHQNIRTEDCQITRYQAIKHTAMCHNIHAKHNTDTTQQTTKRQVRRSQSRKARQNPARHISNAKTPCTACIYCPKSKHL